MKLIFLVTLVLGLALATLATIDVANSNASTDKKKRVLGLFNVLKFPNSNCNSTDNSYDGTCYTSEECSSRGGKSQGSCASGYGVCCTFKKGCGSTSSENSTYLDSSADTQLPQACTYTICPKANICRIRLDFVSFSITGPVTSADATVTTTGGAIGDCVTDRFSVTSSGSKGSPVICGENTGQHMYVDVSSDCIQANFYLGTTSTARSWNINVTQHACGSEMGGPAGCLQFFIGTTDTITSFNYGTAPHHLSNQNYDICVRRAAGLTQLCLADISVTNSNFGLSSAADKTAVINAACTTDYISIHGATKMGMSGVSDVYRNCGTLLSTEAGGTPNIICTSTAPFRITFTSDGNEVVNTGGDTELTSTPAGTYGFSLTYTQS